MKYTVKTILILTACIACYLGGYISGYGLARRQYYQAMKNVPTNRDLDVIAARIEQRISAIQAPTIRDLDKLERQVKEAVKNAAQIKGQVDDLNSHINE